LAIKEFIINFGSGYSNLLTNLKGNPELFEGICSRVNYFPLVYQVPLWRKKREFHFIPFPIWFLGSKPKNSRAKVLN